MFKEAAIYNNHTDLQEYTETVTAYIKKYIDDVTVTKTITTKTAHTSQRPGTLSSSSRRKEDPI